MLDLLQPSRGIMHQLDSPLQEEFKDGDFALLSGIIDYIPFMDSGDATLRVVRDLSKLSPTQAGCIGSKIDYATAGGLGLIRKLDSVFKRQRNAEQAISDSEHDEYASFLIETIDAENLLAQIAKAGQNQLAYGNLVIEVVLTSTAGYRGGSINVYDGAMFRYKREYDKGVRTRGYIAQRWDYSYLSINPDKYTEYAMYPAFSEHKDGTLRSLIHTKNEALYQNWYGLPKSFSSIYFQFMEFQLGKYATRGYENMWLPKVFIETYDMPYDGDTEREREALQRMIDEWANVFTNRGDGTKLPMVYRRSDAGSKPSTIVQLNQATDEGFHQAMSEVAEKQILKSHGWHRSLLEKTVGSIGNNSENSDIAKITDKTVIKPLQEFVLTPFRKAIAAIEKWVGYDSRGLTIDLKSVFEDEAALATTIPQGRPAPQDINNPSNTVV